MNFPQVVSKDLHIDKNKIEAVVELLNEGATIPFIARYRKEKTGGLDETQLRDIEDKLNYLKLLEERRQTILKSIEEQGKLTDELKEKIDACTKLQQLEDLYLPYKPKKKTRATIAIAKGLEPLADFILENPEFDGDFDAKCSEFIDEEKGVKTKEEALQGAKDIIAERISDTAEVREELRKWLQSESIVYSEKTKDSVSAGTENEKLKEKDKKDVYKIYYEFKIDIQKIKPYQILALNRGEQEKFLKVHLEYDEPILLKKIKQTFFEYTESVFMEVLESVVADSFKRLIMPSLEREIRHLLTEQADLHAIEVFAKNLERLLLQPPLSNKIIMGIDPGYASGCKVAVIDTTGKYLEGNTIFPHAPRNKTKEAEKIVLDMIKKNDVDIIAIGNGTASRETELMIAKMITDNKLETHYIIVNEAGASVYSASPLAKREFPELDASMRGNISIARRLHDPLAELVKIDPKSIGVGLYQHDVDQKLLMKKLDDVVVHAVNYVGVDVNTASSALLAYVSGLNKRIADTIIKEREARGRFKNRHELMTIKGIGEKVFEQCAGFLKVPGSDNPFDNTFIHPESYENADKLLSLFNVKKDKIKDSGPLIELFVKSRGFNKIAQDVGIGLPTLTDILNDLKRPGRDPREDMPTPILRSDVLKIEDLKENMRLKGTVRNVVDFGAFVDIGVKQDGLLHISQMKKGYVKNPLSVLNAGDIVEVTIIGIDKDRGRISLSMKEE